MLGMKLSVECYNNLIFLADLAREEPADKMHGPAKMLLTTAKAASQDQDFMLQKTAPFCA